VIVAPSENTVTACRSMFGSKNFVSFVANLCKLAIWIG